jgi:hypothetical protein
VSVGRGFLSVALGITVARTKKDANDFFSLLCQFGVWCFCFLSWWAVFVSSLCT